jgi:hypothetical protein
MALKQRLAAHKQRKAAALRKEAARYRDGKGKQRREVVLLLLGRDL